MGTEEQTGRKNIIFKCSAPIFEARTYSGYMKKNLNPVLIKKKKINKKSAARHAKHHLRVCICILHCTVVNNTAAFLRQQIGPLPTPPTWQSLGHNVPRPRPLKPNTDKKLPPFNFISALLQQIPISDAEGQ